MINKKDFRTCVMAVIKNNGGNCSICNQGTDIYGAMAFANMREIKTSWGKKALMLFIPKDITFTIPYLSIVQYSTHDKQKHIAIELNDGHLVSLREIYK